MPHLAVERLIYLISVDFFSLWLRSQHCDNLSARRIGNIENELSESFSGSVVGIAGYSVRRCTESSAGWRSGLVNRINVRYNSYEVTIQTANRRSTAVSDRRAPFYRLDCRAIKM